MIIKPGGQDRVLNLLTTGAGNSVAQGSVETDSVLVSVFVESVTSGVLDIAVDTLVTDDPDEAVELFSFPQQAAPSTNLLLRKSGVVMQRFRVRASYTGICKFSVYVRAINTAGESSFKLLGSQNWSVSQITAGTSPSLLIPSSLSDRNGLIIRNYEAAGGAVLYVGPDSGSAIPSTGFPINPQESLSVDLSADAEVYGSSSVGTVDTRISQAGS